MRPPNFDELVGADAPAAERERLRRVHDLLVAAGPPAELTPALASPPVRAFSRRRLTAFALAAALAAAAAFGAGWAIRGGGDDFEVRRAVEMQATSAAPTGASALIELGYPDANGNWEMLVHARGLKPLPEDGYYELLLTKDGEPVATCGSFKVDPDGETTVRLGASYSLDEFDGWIVRPYVHDRDRLNETTYLKTTRT